MLASVVVAGLLALRSSASLVIPKTDDISSIDYSVTRRMTMDLKCAGCPFPTDSDSTLMEDGVDSWLEIDFNTDDDKLLMNGQQVFPPPDSPHHQMPPPETVLVRRSDGIRSSPLPFGFVFEAISPDMAASESGAELLSFHITVTDVAGYPVPVDTIHLGTAKAADGSLLIDVGKVESIPTRKMCLKQCRGNPQCLKKLLVQRVRALLVAAKARIAAATGNFPFKGCSGKSHGRHPGGRYHGRFRHALKSIILPAVLGLTAGVTACAVGMVLGHCIASLWISFRRLQGPRRYSDQEAGDETEKEGLMVSDEEDLPPCYEDGDQGRIMLPAEKE